jgi:hypothetical protein
LGEVLHVTSRMVIATTFQTLNLDYPTALHLTVDSTGYETSFTRSMNKKECL